jgi:hypothetical protein
MTWHPDRLPGMDATVPRHAFHHVLTPTLIRYNRTVFLQVDFYVEKYTPRTLSLINSFNCAKFRFVTHAIQLVTSVLSFLFFNDIRK